MSKLVFLDREKKAKLLLLNSDNFTPTPDAVTLSLVSAENEEASFTWTTNELADSYTIKYTNITQGSPEQEETGLTGSSTTITGLTNGDEYDFVIVVVAGGIESADSNTVNATIVDTIAPSPPTALTEEASTAESLTVSATPSVSTDVASYSAYLDQVEVATGLTEANIIAGYEFTGLTAETQYDFQFTAVDDAANESALSTALTATTGTAAPPDTFIDMDDYVNLVGVNNFRFDWIDATGTYFAIESPTVDTHTTFQTSVPFDVDPANSTKLGDFYAGTLGRTAIFSASGNHVFVLTDNSDLIQRFALSTPYNFGTKAGAADAGSISSPGSFSGAFFMDRAGEHFVFIANDAVSYSICSTPEDLTTASLQGTIINDGAAQFGEPITNVRILEGHFVDSGNKMILVVRDADATDNWYLYEYDLSTPYDFLSATYNTTLLSGTISGETAPRQIYVEGTINTAWITLQPDKLYVRSYTPGSPITI